MMVLRHCYAHRPLRISKIKLDAISCIPTPYPSKTEQAIAKKEQII